jgi:hypothetical protein
MGDESLLELTPPHRPETEPFSERLTLDKLVALTDEQALVRLGLEVMEVFARAEGRSLWH